MLDPLKNAILHLVYPATCLHCDELIHPNSPLLCDHCLNLLEFIHPDERCGTCFSTKKNNHLNHCPYCIRHPSLFFQIGAAFDYFGPAATLIKKLKYHNQPHLAKGIGAFLVAQWAHLDWPLPDALVPVPLSFAHQIERGFNQSALLAQEMARILNIPVWDILKRKGGDFSQAGLTVDQRLELQRDSFRLTNQFSIENKTLLVIDDVMTSGATLARCAESLMKGNPSCLYALTACKA